MVNTQVSVDVVLRAVEWGGKHKSGLNTQVSVDVGLRAVELNGQHSWRYLICVIADQLDGIFAVLNIVSLVKLCVLIVFIDLGETCLVVSLLLVYFI